MEVGDCDSIRPWHEDKDKMALLVVELVHLAVRFLRECFLKIGEQK